MDELHVWDLSCFITQGFFKSSETFTNDDVLVRENKLTLRKKSERGVG